MCKKAISFLLGLFLILAAVPALCADRPLRIVCTSFPQYDWVRVILGERAKDAEVSFLLSTGVDLHSYQPTVADIASISGCDLFVFTGGESENWARDALENVEAPKRVVSLMDALGDAARPEEWAEGMQAEAEEEDEALDEHVWLSLKNAKTLVSALCDALCALDGANEGLYRQNAEAYLEKLDALDGKYAALTAGAEVKTLVFADRFPFLYLTKDYGLSYYAAFPGCSAESEATFQTVVFLAGKLNELELDRVCVIETSDTALARTVLSASGRTNGEIVVFQSLQGTTLRQAEAGFSYLAAMEENLSALESALSSK